MGAVYFKWSVDLLLIVIIRVTWSTLIGCEKEELGFICYPVSRPGGEL